MQQSITFTPCVLLISGRRAGDAPSSAGKRERKALHPAVRKLTGGRGGAADEEGVKAMLRSIGRWVLGVAAAAAAVAAAVGVVPAACNMSKCLVGNWLSGLGMKQRQ
jgi:hypothetical protein